MLPEKMGLVAWAKAGVARVQLKRREERLGRTQKKRKRAEVTNVFSGSPGKLQPTLTKKKEKAGDSRRT